MAKLPSSERLYPRRPVCASYFLLLLLWAIPVCSGPKEPSLKKGDPPPGNAANISDQTARITLISALRSARGIDEIKQGWDWFACSVTSNSSGEEKPRKMKSIKKFVSQLPNAWPESYFRSDIASHDKKSAEESGREFIRYANLVDYTRVREHRGTYTGLVHSRDSLFELNWSSQSDAQGFADALNRLAYSAHIGALESNDRAAFQQFQKRALTWRQMSSGTAIPAEADRYRILAANAYEEKQFEAAALYYDQGLGIFDTWPEGWFNAALIYAELNEYWEASDHMKHYLELAPDAPNAKTAREKLIVWDEKAKTEGEEPEPADSGYRTASKKPKKAAPNREKE